MKILVLSQHFYPEEFKINELAEDLVKRGHEVTILTGKPNYPKGKIYDGYKFWGVQEEEYKGARLIHVPLIPRGNASSLRLVLNYFSFVLFGNWYVKHHKLNVDAVICFESSPITQIYPALILKKKIGCKVAMWVQDLWPESVTATGHMKEGFAMKWLNRMVKNIYEKCDILFIQSNGFKKSILDKGDFSKKMVYAPNWADAIFTEKEKIDVNKYGELMPNGFKVMFAGNVGAAQDFDNIIRAAELTKDIPDIKWVIVGDGSKRKSAEQLVKEKHLENTVKFLGRYPVHEMPSFFVHADAMLVTLKDKEIFSVTIPSKTQCYMAAGKPILTMINGEGNNVVKSAQCGLIAAAEDYRTLAENVKEMFAMQRDELLQIGNNGKKYYQSHFTKEKVVTTMMEHICRYNK